MSAHPEATSSIGLRFSGVERQLANWVCSNSREEHRGEVVVSPFEQMTMMMSGRVGSLLNNIAAICGF
ncbi:hypothetical protein Q3G72_015487 [Acer saccharum]|nr:hypothetical protein Q3G72_015487 [Acer saccharum]